MSIGGVSQRTVFRGEVQRQAMGRDKNIGQDMPS